MVPAEAATRTDVRIMVGWENVKCRNQIAQDESLQHYERVEEAMRTGESRRMLVKLFGR